MEKMDKAIEYAQKFHGEELRKSGETVFEHVFGVMSLLKAIGIEDEDLLTASLLHHSYGKHANYISKENIHEEFGSGVLRLLEGYIELSAGNISNIDVTEENQSKVLRAYLNLASDYKLILLRLADKVHNVKTLSSLDHEMRARSARRSLFIYVPLCKIIGLYDYQKALENEVFKVLNSADYFLVSSILEKKCEEYEVLLQEICTVISNFLENEYGINVLVSARVKEPYSMYRKSFKYQKGNQKFTIDRLKTIYDILAVRIIVDTVELCYSVESFLQNLLVVVPEERDDYISMPKPSGYRSLHNVFKYDENTFIEVQIRTHEMHEENEFGRASHVLYKLGDVIKDLFDNDPNILKELNVGIPDMEPKLDKFKKYVYVFTPKGDVIRLPRGATPIDFAFSIHSNLGINCSGALVNGKIVPLSYTLNDGDYVKIIKSRGVAAVSMDWINLVKTKKAKSDIAKYVKEKLHK